MNFINNIFDFNVINALGWTLIHSIWQGLLVAVLMTVILFGLKKHSSKTKYLIANCALLLILVLASLTFIDLYQYSDNVLPSIFTISENSTSGFILNLSIEQEGVWTFASFFGEHLDLIIGVWLIGLIFFVLKFLFGLHTLKLLRSSCQHLTGPLQNTLYEFSRKLNYKNRIGLGESSLISMPIVIGYLKPMILFPVGMLNSLSANEVESIIAHELAHIVRNDFLFNLIQSIVESIFYFNPGVWWISAMIRSERENCCDDIAVELCGNSLAYAKTLVKVEEMYDKAPSLALGFFKDKKALLSRVRRILKQPQNKGVLTEKFVICSLMLIGMFFMVVNKNLAENSSNESFVNSKIELVNSALGEIDNFIPIPPIPPLPPVPPMPPKWVKKVKPLEKNDHPLSPKVDFLNEKFKKVKIPATPFSWEKIADKLKTEIDSIPEVQPNISIVVNEDSESELKIKMENGEVKELVVDGEKIDEEDYDDYLETESGIRLDLNYKKFRELESFRNLIEDQQLENAKILELALLRKDELLNEDGEDMEDWSVMIEKELARTEERRKLFMDEIETKMKKFDNKSYDIEFFHGDQILDLEESFADLGEELESLFDDQEELKRENHIHYFKQWLVNDLVHKGHLKNIEEYEIIIKQDEMTVDGKKMSKNDTQYYIEEIEEFNRTKWRKGNKLKLKKSKNFEKSTLNLDGSWNLNWEKI